MLFRSRWEERSLNEHLTNKKQQAMYAVIHGGTDPNLRKRSAEILGNLPFDGYAIGGSMGENHQQMFDIIDNLMPHMPYDKPNHLLGIGDLNSILPFVTKGIDTMDSSYPTKCARHGVLFHPTQSIKINNAQYTHMHEPIDRNCTCYTCKHYTVAYIRHLFKAHELTAYTLATIHNIHFMMNYMDQIRLRILEGQI